MSSNVPVPPQASVNPGVEPGHNLESLLSFRISILSKLLDRQLARLLGDNFGLTVAEYRVLAQVWMVPRSTIRGIATRTYVDKAQVSRAVAVLEAQELLSRLPHAVDRRSPTFDLTPEGRKLIESVIPPRLEADAKLADALEGKELKALDSSLDKLIALAAGWNAAEPELTVTARRRALRQARIGTAS